MEMKVKEYAYCVFIYVRESSEQVSVREGEGEACAYIVVGSLSLFLAPSLRATLRRRGPIIGTLAYSLLVAAHSYAYPGHTPPSLLPQSYIH